MTDAQAALAHVREALAAGPRPGEWRVSKYRDGRQALIYDADDFEVARVCYPNRDADAALIAACSPANIAAILAHVEAQAAENERLRAGLRAVSDLIDESHGVAGLHRNGDVAPWGDLRTGGKYEEWLVSFDDALKEQR